jgi:TolA-binding protein
MSNAELKENLLAPKIEGVLRWVIDHRPLFLIVAGAVVLGGLVTSVFVLRRQEKTGADWTRLSQAQFLAAQKKDAEALQVLNDVHATTPDADARLHSSYYIGQIALTEKKYDDAIAAFSEIVSSARGHALRPLALSSLGFAYEEKGDFNNAVQSYRTFMTDYPEHFLGSRMQLALGRALAAAGDTAGAKEALTHLIDLYPTSPWAENARQILDKVKTR